MDSKDYIKRRIILLIVITLISIPVFFLGIQYLGKAAPTKANLVVNTRKITSPLFYNWQTLASYKKRDWGFSLCFRPDLLLLEPLYPDIEFPKKTRGWK